MRIGGSCGVYANSNAATVTVCAPAAITGQSQNVSFYYPNETVTISVTVTGTNLTYQWYQGETGNTAAPISGATAASLTRTVSVTHPVWARVVSACGSAVNSATIWLSIQPTMTVQPKDVYLSAGSRATFAVGSNNPGYLSWNWWSNNALMTTNSVYTTAPVSAGPGAQVASTYATVYSGKAGTPSYPAAAYTCVGPDLRAPVVYGGSCRTLEVWPNGEICYVQWYKGAVGDHVNSQLVLESAWAPHLQVCNVTAPATYWVRAYGTDYNYGNPADNWSCYTDSPAITVNP